MRTFASLLSDVKKRLKKTLLEKEKFIIMSNFSCARNYNFCQIFERGGKKHCGVKWKKIIVISDK